MAISLVLRASMCQTKPWRISITLGIHDLCRVQIFMSVVVEEDMVFTPMWILRQAYVPTSTLLIAAAVLVFADQIRWEVLKPWLKTRCH
jgi:hypothetical protein